MSIAYLITAYKNPQYDNLSGLFSLMATIYDEQNTYLIYIDGDTDTDYVEAVCGMLGYPNIYVMHGEPVAWAMVSQMDEILWGIHALLQLSNRWTHFVMLSGDDIAVRTQEDLHKRVKHWPSETCLIPSPTHERSAGEGLVDEALRIERDAADLHLYRAPVGTETGRIINRSHQPKLMFKRKTQFLVAPRSTFTFQRFVEHSVQNFIEIPELGVAMQRPVPWYLARIRARVIETAGWARGAGWITLSRGFCQYALDAPLAHTLYAAFGSTASLLETFFQMLIKNAPSHFRDAWLSRSLMYCNWKPGDLSITSEDIPKIENNPEYTFCRKIVPGKSDAAVEHFVNHLSGDKPQVIGYLTRTAGAHTGFEVRDAVSLPGEWLFSWDSGAGARQLTLHEDGRTDGQHAHETRWASRDGKLLLFHANGQVSSELSDISTNGAEVFISGDFVLTSNSGIVLVVRSPLAERFLKEQDETMVSVPLAAPAPGIEIFASGLPLAHLAKLYLDDFHWEKQFLTPLPAESGRLVYEQGEVFREARAGDGRVRTSRCIEFHANPSSSLLLFSDIPAQRPDERTAISTLLGTGCGHFGVNFGVTDIVGAPWQLDGCDLRQEVRFLPDNKAVMEGDEPALWKIRKGRLLILGASGFLVFDKLCCRGNSIFLSGSRRTGGLRAEYVRLTRSVGARAA
jgi:hypothetical protein